MPPKAPISEELEDKLDQLCESFKAGGPDSSSSETEEAAKEFVIDYIALHEGLKDLEPEERDAIWQWAANQMKSWDPNDASLTYSAKLLRLLGEARDGKTMLFMESLTSQRTNEERQRQSDRGNTPKRKNVLTQFIADAIKRQPDLTLEELWTKLEYAKGDSQICSIDSESVEYYTGEGSNTKIVSKQAVASRLSRQKNKA